MEGIFKKQLNDTVARSTTRTEDLTGRVLIINHDNTVNLQITDYTSGVAGVVYNVPVDFNSAGITVIYPGDLVSVKWLGGSKVTMVVNGMLHSNTNSSIYDIDSETPDYSAPTDNTNMDALGLSMNSAHFNPTDPAKPAAGDISYLPGTYSKAPKPSYTHNNDTPWSDPLQPQPPSSQNTGSSSENVWDIPLQPPGSGLGYVKPPSGPSQTPYSQIKPGGGVMV